MTFITPPKTDICDLTTKNNLLKNDLNQYILSLLTQIIYFFTDFYRKKIL